MGEPLRALEGVSPAKARSMTTAKEASEGVKVAKEQASEQSLNELVQRASSQTASLVRKEIRLAQVELQEKGKRAGIGAGMFGGSGVVALYGVGTLTGAAILALATAMTGWLAALVVAVVLFAVAGVLALSGKRQLQRATPPAPEAAIESVQTDIEEVKQRRVADDAESQGSQGAADGRAAGRRRAGAGRQGGSGRRR
jgi:uncharacterized membrane protein YqjE